MLNRSSYLVALVAAFLTVGGYADSEYDGKAPAERPPQILIEKVDPKSGKATQIAITTADPSMTEAALGKLSDDERKKVIEAYLAKAEKSGKVESTETVSLVKEKAKGSEYDEKSSAPQCRGRFYGRSGRLYGSWDHRIGYYGGRGYHYYPRFGYVGGTYLPCWRPAPIVVETRIWLPPPPPPPIITEPHYTVYGIGYCD